MAYDRDRSDPDRYDRNRVERERSGRDDRGPFDRAGDEVRSWFGDDEARRRRERDEREGERWNRGDDRWRGSNSWDVERNYNADRPYGERSSISERSSIGDRAREGYRDYGDRYGREYTNPRDRDFISNSYTPSSYGSTSYGRGSQEFGPEGYGASSRYSTPRAYNREWQSTETWRVPGPHAGRGPRGYTRSEERIREEINDRLTAHGLVDATDVEVQLQNGEATLTGFVDSREAKRAAEDCVEDVQGVREVHNHLRVRSHADTTGVGRTSVLGLTEQETQNASTARQADAASRSRSRT
jgi:hypothetical protein